jgi:DNA-binding NarL/FixJ family response regulator
MKRPPITVSIVDDESGLRESIIGYLKKAGAFQFVSQYAGAEDALAKLPADKPEVVLMDIKMSGMDGIECVRRLKAQMPEVQVIMLTVFEDLELIFDALKAGASGYLLKRQPPQKLIEAIREVVDGGSPMSAPIARKVVQLLQSSAIRRQSSGGNSVELSARERDVLDQLAAGQGYKQTADNLGVSIHTVRSYVRRIYEKLHVHTRAEAVAKYLK